jgi:ABC-type glycerol-3-phosphate transport system substrate-binding protein
MSRDQYSEAFYPTALDDFTGRTGDLYAIPLQIDGLMVIYNKRLLGEAGYSSPPSDWDSFMEAAYKLTTTDSSGKISQSGLAIGTARNITHATDILSYFMLQNQAELMNEERTAVNLTSERAVIAFETYTSFANSETPTWAAYLPSDLTMFGREQLAMMFGTTWRALDILENYEDVEFGLAPMPILPTNEEVYYSTYWAHSVSKTSKHSQEAWKFIQFLSEPEQQRRLYQNSAKTRTFGEPYSRVSMNEELKENQYTNPIALMAPYMKSWQMGDQAFVEEKLRDAITNVAEEERSALWALQEIEEEINIQLAITNK